MKTLAAVLGGALALVVNQGVLAAEDPLRWSYNDYGGIGLLQTRTARMADDGRLAIGYARFAPHQNFYLTFQALPWLETTFRYDIFERERSGNDLFDRSFDTKIRLFKETRYFPDFAVGLQDILGTGVSAGEYIVASKRFYDFDFTLGLGWGRFGSQADLRNPLSIFSSRFDTRSAETGEGGRVRFGDFFRGRDVALFGGVEYITPVDGLRLKLEFTGDAYVGEEAAAPDFDQKTRLNFGVEYRPFPWISLAAAYEQGDVFMLRATVSVNAKDPIPLPKRKEVLPAIPRALAAKRLAKAQAATEKATTEKAQAETDKPVAPSKPTAPSSFFESLTSARLDVAEILHNDAGMEILLAPDGSPGQLPHARRTVARAAARTDRPTNSIRVVLASDASGAVSDRPAERTVPPPRAKPATPRRASAPLAAAGPAPQPTPQSTPQPTPQPTQSEQAVLTALLRKDLKAAGLDLYALKLDPLAVEVYFENTRYRNPALAIGRGARIIANALPRSIELITIVLWDRGLETARLSLLRKDLENALASKGSPQEIWANLRTAARTGAVARDASAADGVYPAFTWSVGPALRQGLFDPDAPYLYQIWAKTNASVRLARGLDVSGTLGVSIVDNFERSTRRSDSALPHVRSDVTRYIQEGRRGITRLQANYMWNAAPDVFARVTGGYLEEMFGGVSGEILYRPRKRRWAVGLDLHRVRQRKFNQLFGFRDYTVTTGHLNVHYDMPFHGYLANISVGRYLARDWGATFELIRRFNSGIDIGGFFTLTDVPFEEFGEGSFDKGIFISIPLDIFFTRHTRRRGNYVIRPLTRDGGQRVASARKLYEATNDSRLDNIARNWTSILK